MNLAYTHGEEITREDVTALASFLDTRKLERIDTNPERLCFVTDGSKPILRIAEKTLRDYPVRGSFIDKLLKWHHLSRWHLKNASNETCVSFFNDLLLAIKGESVRVYVEDGEAKTITSSRYSEFFDDDIVAACKGLPIGSVSRTDKVLRMDSEVQFKFQPRVGDDCGFGFTILNSETGFHALQVSHYIMRYACTNGMVMRIPTTDGTPPSRVHYKVSTNSLKKNLDMQIANIALTRKEIITLIAQAALRPPHPLMQKRAASGLNSIGGDTKTIRKEIAEAVTEWDLANVVTAYARVQPIDLRLKLEQSAGQLLFNRNLSSSEIRSE